MQALLMILDSPLNKAGKVKGIYIHTARNVLIQVDLLLDSRIAACTDRRRGRDNSWQLQQRHCWQLVKKQKMHRGSAESLFAQWSELCMLPDTAKSSPAALVVKLHVASTGSRCNPSSDMSHNRLVGGVC